MLSTEDSTSAAWRLKFAIKERQQCVGLPQNIFARILKIHFHVRIQHETVSKMNIQALRMFGSRRTPVIWKAHVGIHSAKLQNIIFCPNFRVNLVSKNTQLM